MKKWFERLRSGFSGVDDFSRSVLTLVSGSSVALLISYLAQPILTRLYAPGAFGIFDTFAAFIALSIPFASMRYEDAIMLPEEDEEASEVLGLSLALVIGVSLLLFLVLQSGWIQALLGEPDLIPWLIWLPPILIAVRLSKLGEQWLTRIKRFKTFSTGQIVQAGSTTTTRLALAIGQPATNPFGLIAGYGIGYLLNAVWYGFALVKSSFPLSFKHFRLASMKRVAHRYRRFPLFSMPSTLLNALLARLPFILLLYFFNTETVGYFGRAFALFAVPLGLLGNAISQVFFVEGAAVRKTHAFSELANSVHERLVVLGIFPMLALIAVGPQVIGFVLGDPWHVAGTYLQYLSPWLFLAAVASPLTRVFDILEAQQSDFYASILMFVVQTTLLVVGGLTGNIVYTLLLLGIGGVIARIIHLVIIMRLAEVPLSSTFKPYIHHGISAAPLVAILYGVSLLDLPWLTTLLLIASTAFYLFRRLPAQH